MLSSPPPTPQCSQCLSLSRTQPLELEELGLLPLPQVLSVVRAKASDWRDSFIGKCIETPFIREGAWTG